MDMESVYMNRRFFIVGVVSALAGCTDPRSPSHNESKSIKSPQSTTDEEPFSSLPLPENKCSVRSLPNGSYPPFPEELSFKKLKLFAKTFERVYQSSKLRKSGAYDIGLDSSDVQLREKNGGKYIFTVEIKLSFTKEKNMKGAEQEDSLTVAGTKVFNSWYYITNKATMRNPRSDFNKIPTSGWNTIACVDK